MSEEQQWMDSTKAPEARAQLLVAAMTLEQKIAQMHGNMETIDIYSNVDPDINQFDVKRHVAGIEELNIPRMRITNGPVGVGMGDGLESPEATSLPMTIALAATFDPELAADYGDIIGSETHTYGQHVLEGPGLCLHRMPTGGRNFEYFSEHPYLTGVMGVEVTKAIQKHNIIAMAKHFVLNDTEVERFRTNVIIDEHVLREIYLLPFEMVVKDGDVSAIMGAYNRVRGTYATDNPYLMTDILRDEWGFTGYVQSDFWSARSAAPALHAGLDLEMPDGKWFSETNLKNALHDMSLEEEAIDRALVRRFTQMFRFGQFEWPYEPGTVDAEAHGRRSRSVGAHSAVLLKNDDAALPLTVSATKIFLVGQETYVGKACLGGGGSSRVKPLYTVDPLPGMQDVIAELGGNSTAELFIVNEDLSNLAEAKEAAHNADQVVIMAGLVATEGEDLENIDLPHRQNQMISELASANASCVVVLKDSNPVAMPWINEVPAVLEAWNQGSEDGHAVADVLFGAVNPSGKLPSTYAKSMDDLATAGDATRYPGTDEGDGFPVMRYSEGLKMGYRWFQSENIEPLFPFGFGLSYTTFELSNVSVDAGATPGSNVVTVNATVTNTGTRDGAEVVQVYLELPAAANQPPRRLVGFQKVHVAAGQSAAVTISVDPNASNHPLSVWGYAERAFVVPAGEFTVHVGTSSAHTAAAGTFTVG